MYIFFALKRRKKKHYQWSRMNASVTVLFMAGRLFPSMPGVCLSASVASCFLLQIVTVGVNTYICICSTPTVTICGLWYNYTERTLVKVSGRERVIWYNHLFDKASTCTTIDGFQSVSSAQFYSQVLGKTVVSFSSTSQRWHTLGSFIQAYAIKMSSPCEIWSRNTSPRLFYTLMLFCVYCKCAANILLRKHITKNVTIELNFKRILQHWDVKIVVHRLSVRKIKSLGQILAYSVALT